MGGVGCAATGPMNPSLKSLDKLKNPGYGLVVEQLAGIQALAQKHVSGVDAFFEVKDGFFEL